jgi:hypothetical protein
LLMAFVTKNAREGRKRTKSDWVMGNAADFNEN